MCDTRSNSVKGLIPECQHGTQNPICALMGLPLQQSTDLKKFHEPINPHSTESSVHSLETLNRTSPPRCMKWCFGIDGKHPKQYRQLGHTSPVCHHTGVSKVVSTSRGKGKESGPGASIRQTADNPPPQNEEETHASMSSMYCEYFHRNTHPEYGALAACRRE